MASLDKDNTIVDLDLILKGFNLRNFLPIWVGELCDIRLNVFERLQQPLKIAVPLPESLRTLLGNYSWNLIFTDDFMPLLSAISII